VNIADHGYILAPKIAAIDFAVEPVINCLESLRAIELMQDLSGLGAWVGETAARMTPEQRFMNKVVVDALDLVYACAISAEPGDRDFEHYIARIAAADPYAIRDRVIDEIVDIDKYAVSKPENATRPTAEALLGDPQIMLDWLILNKGQFELEPDVYTAAHALLNDPPRMIDTIVDHLQSMWDLYLKDEWTRVKPMIEESVAAFSALDYTGLSAYDAIKAVTGRDPGPTWRAMIDRIDHLRFVPSAQIGPYISLVQARGEMFLLFGARLPKGMQAPASSALTRSELLVRINALADETRLRILEMLTEEDELFAQTIIERLGLSQSSVSRHLSQLSATGYISERRQDVAKAYSLNPERVSDTLNALTQFLSRK
jgi:ArsR family transcriptional regulator